MVDYVITAYLDAVSNGEAHKSVLPLQGEVVDFTIQFSHGDRLGIHDVLVHRLIEVIFEAGRKQPLAHLL